MEVYEQNFQHYLDLVSWLPNLQVISAWDKRSTEFPTNTVSNLVFRIPETYAMKDHEDSLYLPPYSFVERAES